MRTVPLLLGLAATWLLAAPAGAQSPLPAGRLPCHRFEEIVRQLDQKYDEAPVSVGIQMNGNLLQVFASAKQGTWTILSTSPGGLTCIIAAGRGWEALAPRSTDPEA